ncbi:hypothetical protein F511_21295 [Dorcoceras hygrometricum]|uniref:Uncharacterized protein n=1 Tax=Dorcoceras hygrometricum TaxID=472368 RepID=A0A2Z7BLA8_9LAMI|nr:hypothetical protein F511_21295 [Dorcoceras hygrometricum]
MDALCRLTSSPCSARSMPARPPNKKKDMKVEYRLLHDIVAKSLCAKSRSFDVVTSDKFDMMMAISVGLKVYWGHILFQTLVAMVYMPSKQSQGLVVSLSILLERLVKTDLGESVALHPLKVLNNRSVLTYMKKNQAIPQAGEMIKKSGDTASETNSLLGSTVVDEEEGGEGSGGEEKEREGGSGVQADERQAGPAKSKSGTSSDKDTCPLAKLGVAKKGGAAPKRKLVLASSDSKSTVSLPLVVITKKQRTKSVGTVTAPDPAPGAQRKISKFCTGNGQYITNTANKHK